MTRPQKSCDYCATPALRLATKCESCGSALPVALPRPLARAVEIQSHWSLQTTGIVTSSISFGLGLLNASGWMSVVAITLLIILWLLAVMPGMLLVSAWLNANNKISSFIAKVLITIGLWWLGALLCLIGSVI